MLLVDWYINCVLIVLIDIYPAQHILLKSGTAEDFTVLTIYIQNRGGYTSVITRVFVYTSGSQRGGIPPWGGIWDFLGGGGGWLRCKFPFF